MGVLKRLTTLLLLAALVSAEARAQYDAAFSHYFHLEPAFNPAAVGKQSKLNVTGTYALNLAGFEHNPRVMLLAADLPFRFAGAFHGAGVQVMNDQIGLFKHQKIAAQYAYKQRLLGGELAIGLQAGLLLESFDGTKADPADASDHAIATAQVTGNGFDMGLGLYYVHGMWYAGASAQHLTSPTILLGEKQELHIGAAYYLTGGCNIRLRNPFVTIKPSVLLRTDGTAYRVDVTGRVVYTSEKRMLYAGVGYSPTVSVTGMIGGSFHGIVVGYAYEMYTTVIKPGNGSHELFVGYQQDLNFAKKGKNKHKSVRIL